MYAVTQAARRNYNALPHPNTVPAIWGELTEDILQRYGIERTPGGRVHFIKSRGGERIAVEESGPKDGFPILSWHGNPGSRLSAKPTPDVLQRMGIRFIAMDRNEFGFTGRISDGRPIGGVAMAEDILSYFAIDSVIGILGRSCGSPEALACAAKLERASRTAVIVPPGPPQYMGSKSFFAGMCEFNRNIFEAAFAQPPDVAYLKKTLGDFALRMTSEAEAIVDTVITPYEILDDASKQVSAAAHAAGLRPGSQGWEAATLGGADWGFDPRDISGPVFIWFATKDVFTPPAHGAWLAEHIPGATSVCVSGTHGSAREGTYAALEWMMG